MSHHGKSSGIAATLLVLLLAYHFRAQILAWLGGVSPSFAAMVAPLVGSSGSDGALTSLPREIGDFFGFPGDNGNGRTVNLFQGILQAGSMDSAGSGPASYQNNPGGFGGGAIEEGNSQGGGNTGPVPNSFGHCSTNPRDGKLLCA
jgi:hypothetical protein